MSRTPIPRAIPWQRMTYIATVAQNSDHSYVAECTHYVNTFNPKIIHEGVRVNVRFSLPDNPLYNVDQIVCIRRRGGSLGVACTRPAHELGLQPGDLIGVEFTDIINDNEDRRR